MDRIFTYEDIAKFYPIAAIVFKSKYPKGASAKDLKPMDKWLLKIFSEIKSKEWYKWE